MNYAGPDWPTIITIAVIAAAAIVTVILSSQRLRAARAAGLKRPGGRILQIVAIVIGAICILWLIASLIGNLSMSAR